jgi:hypothetical protein
VEDGFGGVVVAATIHGLEEGDQGGVVGVDGRDDGEVVLEFVEVVCGGGEGVVERVLERRVVGAEGELIDVVGEVECCCPIISLPWFPFRIRV